MPMNLNFPAARLMLTLVLQKPDHLLPHLTVPNFLNLPLPLGAAIGQAYNIPAPTIRAVVLDKDNTICPPDSLAIHPSHAFKLAKLREEFKDPNAILIVSNTAGSTPAPEHDRMAREFERDTGGIPVLRQTEGLKKPYAGKQILEWFRERGVVERADEIVIVGDRLATDVAMANDMGAWSVWCKEGWRNPEKWGQDHRGFMARMEVRLEAWLRWRGFQAPMPRHTRALNPRSESEKSAALGDLS